MTLNSTREGRWLARIFDAGRYAADVARLREAMAGAPLGPAESMSPVDGEGSESD